MSCNTLFVSGDDYYSVAKVLLNHARHRIYMVMYQISLKGPALELVEKMALSAQKVKDVQFILNISGNNSLKNGVRQFVNQFQHGKNVKIYIVPDETVHAKLLIVDDWLLLGSSNLSRHGLGVNREANIVTNSPDAVAGAVAWFKELRNEAEPVL